MNIGEAERQLKDQLTNIYDSQEASNIADLLLEHITGFSRIERISKKGINLLPGQQQTLHSKLQQLLDHEPVQYVIGSVHFYGMELFVNNAVLIPRPETEELVNWIIKDVKSSGLDVFKRGPMQADSTKTLKIIDIGTGSGCIALALKKNMPKAEVWGCDISEEALNVARRNGSHLDTRVDFQGVDILDFAQQKSLPMVDIIVSNPPYVPLNNKEQMSANVLNFEPHTALFVPDNDPLLFYRALSELGKHRLYEKGSIYLEIHEELGPAVESLFKDELYASVEIKKDMQGKDRMVKVRKGV
jgi:release factor glutamine methyltransferase